MYTLDTAYVRHNSRNGRWEEDNIADRSVQALLSDGTDVWMFLLYPSITQPRAVLLEDIRNLTNGVANGTTVQEWLTALGNRTLPFHDEVPSFETHYVKYANAWHAGYHIEPITRIGTLSQQGSKWDKEDLLIWRKDVEPETLARNAMFTINGLFHPAEWGPEGVHIHMGNRTLRQTNDNQIGVHSFANVGQLSYVPITPDMVTSQREGAPLHTGVYVTLPDGVDMEGKTFLVVLGGYLQVLGKTYTRVGERTYRIELANLMMVERFYDSWKDLNLAEILGFTQYDYNDTLFEVKEILKDETVRKFLTMPQSFFVAVETDSFFQEIVAVESSGLPGRYYDHETTRYPLMGAYGRMLEYHPIEEDGITVMCTTPNQRHNYDFFRRPWTKSEGIDAGRYPYRPYTHTHAFYRLMGSQR